MIIRFFRVGHIWLPTHKIDGGYFIQRTKPKDRNSPTTYLKRILKCPTPSSNNS